MLCGHNLHILEEEIVNGRVGAHTLPARLHRLKRRFVRHLVYFVRALLAYRSGPNQTVRTNQQQCESTWTGSTVDGAKATEGTGASGEAGTGYAVDS